MALWVIITLTFILMQSLPGDPFYAEQALPQQIHEALRKHYGLDDPWYSQYLRYLKSIVQWDFGPSFRYKDRSVNDIIKEGFPVSAALGLEALALAISTGILLGTWSALNRHKWQDGTAMLIGAIGISVPSFILATLLQYFLSYRLGLFPVARWGSFVHTILPAISLAALPAAFIARMTRSNMIEVLKQDYIKAARAKGLSEPRIVCVHALRNALLPVLSYLGPLTANILTGSFVVEKIFAIPGLGQWFVNSVANRDYTVIMGTTVFYSIILLGTILLVDIAYGYLDPRIKVEG